MMTAGVTALGAGLVTGLHCIGMCGPLTCALCPKAAASLHTLSVYHGARTCSYTLIGCGIGAVGASIAVFFTSLTAQALAWSLFAFFLVIGLGVEKWMKPPSILRSVWRRLVGWSGAHPVAGAAAVGFVTPLLPCAPLYLAFGVALTAGSAIAGGIVMFAFAIGTMVPLFLAQIGFVRLRDTLGRAHLTTIQRSLALVAAGLILWRILEGSPFQPGIEPKCPMCPPAKTG